MNVFTHHLYTSFSWLRDRSIHLQAVTVALRSAVETADSVPCLAAKAAPKLAAVDEPSEIDSYSRRCQ